MPHAVRNLRWQLVAAPALAAVLAGAMPFVIDPHTQLPLALGGIGVVAVAVALWPWLATRRLATVAKLAPAVAAGDGDAAALPSGAGEIGHIVAAVRSLAEQRAAFRDQVIAGFADAAGQARFDGTPQPPAEPPESWPADVRAGFDDLFKHVRSLRQHATGKSKVLNDLPRPLVVTDGRGKLQYANAAAERLFGRSRSALVGSPVTDLLVDTTVRDEGGKPAKFRDWLDSRGGIARGVGRCAGGQKLPLEVRATDAPTSRQLGAQVLMFADLTDRLRAESAGRAAAREATGRQLVAQIVHDTKRPLHEMATHARMLIREAKQLGQRDRLLPKLTAVREHVDAQQVTANTLDWLQRALWGQLPPQAPAEFVALEAVHAVEERLAARLRQNRNTLAVQGDGGWLYCDSEWFAAVLTGLLAHAAAACEGATIEVRLRRLPGGSADGGDALDVLIPDAGPAADGAAVERLRDPFGDHRRAPAAGPDATGFPLGLATALQLAPHLGGELDVQASANGRLSLRLRLPSRLLADSSAPPTALADTGVAAPVEETCAGWRLGVPA